MATNLTEERRQYIRRWGYGLVAFGIVLFAIGIVLLVGGSTR